MAALAFSPISLACGITGLSIILLSTVSSVYVLASTGLKTKVRNVSQLYRDEDGVATEDSMAEYSTKIPTILICILSILGLGDAIALAVLSTLGLTNDNYFIENWLNVASWVFMLRPAV